MSSFSPTGLASLMADRDISMTELARRIAINDTPRCVMNTRERIRHYVRGHRTPTEETVVRLAEAICQGAAEADRVRMFKLLGLDQVTTIDDDATSSSEARGGR